MTRAAVIITTLILLFTSMTPILFSLNDDDVNLTGIIDLSSSKTIHSLDELLLIGNDDEYPLSANYIQKDNIDFGNGDYNGGFNIDTKVGIKDTSGDGTYYEITISLHYSDTELSPIITIILPALISLNGTIQKVYSGDMEATFTFLSNEFPSTLDISAGGIANNVPDEAWIDEEDTTDTGDPSFAIACSLTGITGTTEEWEYTSNSNGNFTPIGSESVPFTGTYDGGGFTVNNLNTAVFSEDLIFSGMFGHIASNRVELTGIGLTNNSSIAAITSEDPATVCVGSLVGSIYGTDNVIIQNCYTIGDVTVTVSSDYECVQSGGLIGFIDADGSTLTMQDCYVIGNITTTVSSPSYAYVYSGGLVGEINVDQRTATIENCYAGGNITTTVSSFSNESEVHAGGLIGRFQALNATSMIRNTYAIGNVTTTASSYYDPTVYTGGLIGCVHISTAIATIQNCYAVGEITADAAGEGSITIAEGGIVGYFYGTSYIYNCYYHSEDEINKELKIFGGKNSSAKVHVDGNPNGDGTSGRPDDRPSGGRTLEELQKKETYYDEETTVPGSDPEQEVNGWIFYDPNDTEKECIWFIDEKIDENDTREPNERFNNGLPVLIIIEFGTISQPEDIISNNVANNTFSMTMSRQNVTYQWYYSIDDPSIPNDKRTWILIPNATSEKYTTADDNGIDNFNNFYRCIVTIAPNTSLISNSAQLLMGDDTNITINVDGKGTVSYNDDEITTSKTYTGPSDINVPMIITIVPDEHNTLESVEFNGKDITSESKGDNTFIIFPKTENDILNITFREIEYGISISDDIENGKISLEDNITIITNSKTCEITITPDANYILDKIWIIEDEDDEDGDPKTATLTKVNDTKYKLSNVAGNCTINAIFKAVAIPDEDDPDDNMKTIIMMLYGITALIAMLIGLITSVNRS